MVIHNWYHLGYIVEVKLVAIQFSKQTKDAIGTIMIVVAFLFLLASIIVIILSGMGIM